MTDPSTVNVIKEEIPQQVVYDESFTVKKQRWGTFVSYDLEGTILITSITEDSCISATRWYLKARQEGFEEPIANYQSTVEGKL
jgi:hypothetical protein